MDGAVCSVGAPLRDALAIDARKLPAWHRAWHRGVLADHAGYLATVVNNGGDGGVLYLYSFGIVDILKEDQRSAERYQPKFLANMKSLFRSPEGARDPTCECAGMRGKRTVQSCEELYRPAKTNLAKLRFPCTGPYSGPYAFAVPDKLLQFYDGSSLVDELGGCYYK